MCYCTYAPACSDYTSDSILCNFYPCKYPIYLDKNQTPISKIEEEVITMKANKVQKHADICKELNELYERKSHDYGDSFHQTFIEEGMAMARIRLGDKFSRFKTLSKGTKQQVSDESIRGILIDLANYAIMTVMEMDLQKETSNDCFVDDSED